MLKITVMLAILTLTFQLCGNTKLINVNPDPNGEPWIAGGISPLTEKQREKLSKIKEFTIPEQFKDRELPISIDNSTREYFRPVFNQSGGSCGQASGVAYNFTYEINALRELPANEKENQYPTHYTWNMLNGGEEYGSWYFDGWDIIKDNGCPNVISWGGSLAAGGDKHWMSGFEKYREGMQNRVLEYNYINVATPAGLTTLKNWLYDHGNDSNYGGLANFAAGSDGMDLQNLAEGTPHAGFSVIKQWGPAMDHAMTFIGYDDSICFDYNNDGSYTNDEDINGDGIVNMKDWEKGALLMVNSWGTSWGTGGKSYMMYKLLAESEQSGGVYENIVYLLKAQEEYTAQMALKVKLRHTSRGKIAVSAGVSNDLNASSSQYTLKYSLFNYQGGDLNMGGGSSESEETIEIGLDVTSLLEQVDTSMPLKFFLSVNEVDVNNSSEGEVISLSLVDFTNNDYEYLCPESDITILNNGTTVLTVNRIPGVYPPKDFTGIAQENSVELFWSTYGDETGLNNYKVLRDGEVIADNLSVLSYTDDSVTAGESYLYSIVAVYTGDDLIEEKTKKLKITPGEAQSLPYFQDFEISFEPWTIKNNILGWQWGNKSSLESSNVSFDGNESMFIACNSDKAGSGHTVVDKALSPEMHLRGKDKVFLSFDYRMKGGNQQYHNDIKILASLSDMSDWMEVAILPSNSNWETYSVEIPQEVLVSNNSRIAFLFDDYHTYGYGGGIDNIRISTDNSIENDGESVNISKSASLAQNFPNPFNPSTIINYVVQKADNINIAVFNIAGKKVWETGEMKQEIGKYSILFNGSKLNSGVYFYTLEVGGIKQEIKKMIMVK